MLCSYVDHFHDYRVSHSPDVDYKDLTWARLHKMTNRIWNDGHVCNEVISLHYEIIVRHFTVIVTLELTMSHV